MSLNAVLTCSDSSWTSPGVVWSLSLLAPYLAPRMKLASLMFYPGAWPGGSSTGLCQAIMRSFRNGGLSSSCSAWQVGACSSPGRKPG